MADVLKLGGKDPNNKVKAFNVDADGILNTHHVWEGGFIQVMQANIRDTDAHISDVFDISKYSLVSLRISNTCDQPANILFYGDASTGSYLADLEGDVILEIANKSREQIITPEDLPWLPYMNNLKMRVFFSVAPTSGTITIRIAYKR